MSGESKFSTPQYVNEVIVLCVPSKPASAPSNESWPRNLPSSASAGCPKSSESNQRWSKPTANHRSQPQAFIRRVASAGFRLPSFMAVHKYLERCRDRNDLPDSRRPPSRPHPLVPALSRPRLLTGMNIDWLNPRVGVAPRFGASRRPNTKTLRISVFSVVKRAPDSAAAGITGDNEMALPVRARAHLSPDFSIRYSTGSGYRFDGL